MLWKDPRTSCHISREHASPPATRKHSQVLSRITQGQFLEGKMPRSRDKGTEGPCSKLKVSTSLQLEV